MKSFAGRVVAGSWIAAVAWLVVATVFVGVSVAQGPQVQITYTDSAKSGRYSAHVQAVWIEDANGAFVKTIARWANKRIQYLRDWNSVSARAVSVDTVTGASLSDYQPRTVTWDLTGVPDGVYTIRMESTDQNASTVAQCNEATFSFNKNGSSSTQSALASGGFKSVSIVYSATVAAPSCGDMVCNGSETCTTCAGDCGSCCGDGMCSGGESCDRCALDCGGCVPSCGDHVCNGAEDCKACATDCGACAASCGDGKCTGSEACDTCEMDCGACPANCGNDTCDADETCDNCGDDCGTCTVGRECGDAVCGESETCAVCASDCGDCAGSPGDGGDADAAVAPTKGESARSKVSGFCAATPPRESSPFGILVAGLLGLSLRVRRKLCRLRLNGP